MEEEPRSQDWESAPRQLAILYAITAALSRSLEAGQILEMIVRGAVELSGADAAGIYEWAPDRQTLVVTVGYGLSADFQNMIQHVHVQPGCGPVGRSIIERSLVEVPDIRDTPDYPFHAEMQTEGYCSVLTVPMLHGDDVLGGITLWRRQPHHTPGQVKALLTALADQAAVALGNARLYEQTERRARELAALVEVGRDITATLDLTRVLERIAHHAWRILETDDCDLYLLDADRRTMRSIVSLGPYAAETMASVGHVGNGIVGSVARTGVPEMVNHVEMDPRAVQIPGTPVQEPQALICAPLVSKGQVIGVMALSRMGERHFVQADLDFLTNLAQQASIAIENAHLYQAARQAEAEARQRADLLVALHQIAQDISGELALDRLLEAVIRRVRELLGRESADLWLYDEAAGLLKCAVRIADWPAPPVSTMLPGQGLNGRVFATGQPIVVDDYWSWEGADPSFTGEPLGPAASVPLTWKGSVRGVLQVAGRAGSRPFSPTEVTAMSLLAAQAAIALENAGLYDAAKQRAQDLATALEQQQEVDRWQAEFIQNVSHELRTPLTLIQGYAEMLNDGELGTLEHDQRAAVAIITRQVRALRALVEDIMMILQLEAQAMHLAPVSLVEMVKAAVDDFKALARQSRLAMEVEIQSGVPYVAGDARHLRKVIDNLLFNAIKFTPADGRITVQVCSDGGGAYVRVSDTGIGIPPQQLDKIFQRFYQVDGSIRRRYGGVGLGLALAQEILDAHNGWIKAESEGIPGRGSTFTFWLPAA